jgi:hypothetical protein
VSNPAIQILDRVAPHFGAALRRWRYRRELHDIFQDLVSRSGRAVLSGPFRGMAYALPSLGAEQIYHYGAVPKLLGCYEAELHGVFARAAATGYDTILNIGCAEGYYVAGLARLFPRAHVFAFDIDASARRLCDEMVNSNGVQSRVTILGECAPTEFDRLASGRTLVLCDCEGCELQLLRPDLAPRLRCSDVLVELHPHVDASISKEIPARFAATHSSTLMQSEPRDLAAFPVLHGYGPHRQKVAVSEFREGIGQWIFFASKAPVSILNAVSNPRSRGFST